MRGRNRAGCGSRINAAFRPSEPYFFLTTQESEHVLTVTKPTLLSAALAVFSAAVLTFTPAQEAQADAVVKAEKTHKSANRSYKVNGKRYNPLTKVSSFSQSGKASFYGDKFHGRKTASGERYNKHALTAAHRTLPIPSYARVTNTKTGKSVVVRINDRGPFHGSRVIDVSRAAAQKLGFIRQGMAHVKVEAVAPGQERETEQFQNDGSRDDFVDFIQSRQTEI